VLITMLADDRAVQDVIFEPGAAIESLPEGAVHISMIPSAWICLADWPSRTRINIRTTLQLLSLAGRMLRLRASCSSCRRDQVNQSRNAAAVRRDGAKNFMINEDAPAANLIKLSGNFLTTTVIESLAEAFALMRKAGVDPQKFLEVLTESMFSAPVYKTYGASSLQRSLSRWVSNCRLDSRTTDCFWPRLKRRSFPCRWSALMHDRFVAALAQGLENADWSAIARVTYRNAGL